MPDGAWSARLHDVFGAEFGEVSVGHIETLVEAGLREDADLEFKDRLYGNGDQEKRDLAGDVAAMWNDQGGVIVARA